MLGFPGIVQIFSALSPCEPGVPEQVAAYSRPVIPVHTQPWAAARATPLARLSSLVRFSSAPACSQLNLPPRSGLIPGCRGPLGDRKGSPWKHWRFRACTTVMRKGLHLSSPPRQCLASNYPCQAKRPLSFICDYTPALYLHGASLLAWGTHRE